MSQAASVICLMGFQRNSGTFMNVGFKLSYSGRQVNTFGWFSCKSYRALIQGQRNNHAPVLYHTQLQSHIPSPK